MNCVATIWTMTPMIPSPWSHVIITSVSCPRVSIQRSGCGIRIHEHEFFFTSQSERSDVEQVRPAQFLLAHYFWLTSGPDLTPETREPYKCHDQVRY